MGTRVQYRPSSAVVGGIPTPAYPRAQAVSARDSPHKHLAAVAVSEGPPAIIEQSKRDAQGNVYTKRFLKGAILGKGGFAKCYRVTDMDTKEEWACKIIEKKSLTKQRHKTKLQTEIKIHRSIAHRHVVKFHDVFEDKDNVYILMEICPNMTMLELVKRKKRLTETDTRRYMLQMNVELVKRKKRLTETDTRRYMLQMLDAVRHMHDKKVIHRDLKLGNIFLGKGNEVKIGDFGLACKLLFDGERKKTLCGTPNYIAPEVLDGKKGHSYKVVKWSIGVVLDGKNGHSYEVDTWSIGVVLYTCLVGKPPFETQDVKSTYKLIKANSYSFPERLEISEVAKRLVRRILQSNPEMRPTVDEVLNDEFFLGEGLALIRANPPSAAAPPSSSSSLSTKLKDGYSASAAPSLLAPASTIATITAGTAPLSSHASMGAANTAAAAPGSEWRAPLRPMSMKHDAYNTPQPALGAETAANKKHKPDVVMAPPSLSSARAPSTASSDAPSALERNIATAQSSASSYRPYTTASLADPASPTRRVIKQLGSCTLSARTSPPKPPLSARAPASSLSSAPPPSSAQRTLTSALGGARPLSAVLAAAGSDAASSASTASLGVNAPSSARDSNRAVGAVGARGAGAVEDEDALRQMHASLVAALQGGESAGASAAGAVLPLPSVWVSRWVDYSKKYGLGYRLSSGAHGVFFNDATKILLGDDHDRFEYIERMRGDDGVKYDQRRPSSVSGHAAGVSGHAADLAKKVTLMKHFKNYLDEQPGEAEAALAGEMPGDASQAGVYVRKWMRTRHSVIFRLSNNAFQVSFLDDTEVFLWPEARHLTAGEQLITFKSRGTPRRTLTSAQAVALPDVAKRVKYVRDILAQLVT
ncbi:kinase-like domain-containing protein [Baffinella frigidus]|nr:kinase-like domain-containing protein [Cryptophyta sp. CCMP2293]